MRTSKSQGCEFKQFSGGTCKERSSKDYEAYKKGVQGKVSGTVDGEQGVGRLACEILASRRGGQNEICRARNSPRDALRDAHALPEALLTRTNHNPRVHLMPPTYPATPRACTRLHPLPPPACPSSHAPLSRL